MVLGAPTSDAKLFPIRARQAPHALTRSFIEFPFFADYYEFYPFFNLEIKPSNLSTLVFQVITVTNKNLLINLLINSFKVSTVILFTKKLIKKRTFHKNDTLLVILFAVSDRPFQSF